MKESADGKLVVDCTAEGVMFVEAEADASVEQFDEGSVFACPDDLLLNPATNPTLGSPLFTMQLTRLLLCGGFVVAFTYHHAISDAIGVAQFLTAVSDLADGRSLAPSVFPIWQREELLNATGPPYASPYETLLGALRGALELPQGDACYRSFFFGAKEVASLRARLPLKLRNSCTSFELIVASVLHCRVTSLQHAPHHQLRVVFAVNCREKFPDLLIPAAYYGNAVIPAIMVCRAQDLRDLGSVVERLKKAKESVTQDYVRSMLDICVTRRRSPSGFSPPTCFFSDLSRVGFSTLRFGSWEKPVYVGRPGQLCSRHFATYMLPFTNSKGEEGRLLDICLPKDAMEIFETALSNLLTFN